MKKIKNFSSICKKINLPLKQIKIIENSLNFKKGSIFLVGGAVRNLVLRKKFENQYPDLVTDLSINDLILCLKRSNIKTLPIGIKFGSVWLLLIKLRLM